MWQVKLKQLWAKISNSVTEEQKNAGISVNKLRKLIIMPLSKCEATSAEDTQPFPLQTAELD